MISTKRAIITLGLRIYFGVVPRISSLFSDREREVTRETLDRLNGPLFSDFLYTDYLVFIFFKLELGTDRLDFIVFKYNFK